jgi:hypothetical protein
VLLAETCSSQTQQTSPQRPTPASNTFVLDDGTPIKLRLTQNVSSANAKAGDKVDFEVVDEVKLGDVIVIRKGSPAVGTVTAARSAKRMHRKGSVSIEIDSVMLADGEKATLRRVAEVSGEGEIGSMISTMILTGSPVWLFESGDEAVIERLYVITGYVNGTMHLDPAKFMTPAALPVISSLQITSQPSKAEIWLDGSFVGSTPSEIRVSEGEHTITISKAGCRTWERTLMVSNGKMRVAATLYPTAVKLR